MNICSSIEAHNASIYSRPFVVQAGTHVFNLRIGEKDYAVDRFLLTTDANYIPTGTGPLWKSSRLPAVTLDWSFGDGSPGSNSQNPARTYANVGVYNVSVLATGAAESASDSLYVVAQETFDAFAARMLPGHSGADRLPGANPDGDLNSNIVEFALGTNPGKADMPAWFK